MILPDSDHMSGNRTSCRDRLTVGGLLRSTLAVCEICWSDVPCPDHAFIPANPDTRGFVRPSTFLSAERVFFFSSDVFLHRSNVQKPRLARVSDILISWYKHRLRTALSLCKMVVRGVE
jgi:hypothetical protein